MPLAKGLPSAPSLGFYPGINRLTRIAILAARNGEDEFTVGANQMNLVIGPVFRIFRVEMPLHQQISAIGAGAHQRMNRAIDNIFLDPSFDIDLVDRRYV